MGKCCLHFVESELVDTSDVDSTLLKTGTSNHRKTGDDQTDCMDTEQAEMAMMVKDDDMNKQQLSKHDKSPVVVLKVTCNIYYDFCDNRHYFTFHLEKLMIVFR